MPYKIVKKFEKGTTTFCVVNSDTGDKKGCSDSFEKAVAHQRALYAADDQGKKKQ